MGKRNTKEPKGDEDGGVGFAQHARQSGAKQRPGRGGRAGQGEEQPRGRGLWVHGDGDGGCCTMETDADGQTKTRLVVLNGCCAAVNFNEMLCSGPTRWKSVNLGGQLGNLALELPPAAGVSRRAGQLMPAGGSVTC